MKYIAIILLAILGLFAYQHFNLSAENAPDRKAEFAVLMDDLKLADNFGFTLTKVSSFRDTTTYRGIGIEGETIEVKVKPGDFDSARADLKILEQAAAIWYTTAGWSEKSPWFREVRGVGYLVGTDGQVEIKAYPADNMAVTAHIMPAKL